MNNLRPEEEFLAQDRAFMRAIESQNVFRIKSDLEGLIPLFRGDKKKCDMAIEYARRVSPFDWEEDDGVYFGDPNDSIEDQYSYEKGRLVQNFTKERYEKVLELYHEVYKDINREYYENLKKQEENKQSNFNSENRESNTRTTNKRVNTNSIGRNGSSQNRGNYRKDKDEDEIKAKLLLGGVAVAVIAGITYVVKKIFS